MTASNLRLLLTMCADHCTPAQVVTEITRIVNKEASRVVCEECALDNLRSQMRAEDTEAQRVVSTHADPIKPDYPDGLYLWRWDGDYPGKSYVERRNGQWIDFQGKPNHELTPPEDCTRVRVLGDDQIAVKLDPTLTAQAVLRDVLHAMSEAGDR